jgi:sulfur relay (sulfurtransferase) complex TusBCD TusD component (DsrE family)
LTGYLLQHSPQDRLGFESFFTSCLETLKTDPDCWIFLRGDGVYQGLSEQRLDEPGFTVPVDGGWNALTARGVRLYVNKRCAELRGVYDADLFLTEANFCDLEQLAQLSLGSDRVVVC